MRIPIGIWAPLCLAALALTACCGKFSAGLDRSSEKTLQSTPAGELSGNLSFLFSPSRDLRRFVYGIEVIAEREARSVCYFDLRGLPMGKAETWTMSCELHVDDGDSVRSVLDKAGFRRWKGGQPQIRLITRNKIFQSPLPEAGRMDDVADFLNLLVKPGDIVVVATVE